MGDETEEQGTEEIGAMLTLDSSSKPPRIFFSKNERSVRNMILF